MEREVGGGIGMGNTCKPMAVSFQCMTKSTTIKKIIIKKKTNRISQFLGLSWPIPWVGLFASQSKMASSFGRCT